jgi:orotate phosphoribosyltransferase
MASQSSSGGIFKLIHPEPGAINTANQTVNVNVAKDTRIVVIQGTLTSGQSASTSATGVTTNSGSVSTFTMTVDTRSLANGGKIEFPVTISERGKSNIVYTIKINTL